MRHICIAVLALCLVPAAAAAQTSTGDPEGLLSVPYRVVSHTERQSYGLGEPFSRLEFTYEYAPSGELVAIHQRTTDPPEGTPEFDSDLEFSYTEGRLFEIAMYLFADHSEILPPVVFRSPDSLRQSDIYYFRIMTSPEDNLPIYASALLYGGSSVPLRHFWVFYSGPFDPESATPAEVLTDSGAVSVARNELGPNRFELIYSLDDVRRGTVEVLTDDAGRPTELVTFDANGESHGEITYQYEEIPSNYQVVFWPLNF
jgi:hypothetical protein